MSFKYCEQKLQEMEQSLQNKNISLTFSCQVCHEHFGDLWLLRLIQSTKVELVLSICTQSQCGG